MFLAFVDCCTWSAGSSPPCASARRSAGLLALGLCSFGSTCTPGAARALWTVSCLVVSVPSFPPGLPPTVLIFPDADALATSVSALYLPAFAYIAAQPLVLSIRRRGILAAETRPPLVVYLRSTPQS